MASGMEEDRISAFFADPDKVTEALARGVREALLQHKRAGNPIVVWREGQIVWVPPEDIPVADEEFPARGK